MVNTRSTHKKNENKEELQDDVKKEVLHQSSQQMKAGDNEQMGLPGTQEQDPELISQKKVLDRAILINAGTTGSQRRSKSSRSKPASSSTAARRKQLEYEAAAAKARLQMELIDKKLAVDLAELESQYSSHSEEAIEDRTNIEVEKWLEHSQQELELLPPAEGIKLGEQQKLPPPPPQAAPAGTETGTVHLLATALKDLVATTSANGSNSKMLSRLCTPRDLPTFSGDPLEWLQFKQAYEESTQLCDFTQKESLWRLRKCLQGPAKDAVTSLLISATSPHNVMSTLELQFGNADIIIARIIQDINKLQPMCELYHKDIIPFSIKVKNFVAAVTAVGHKEYLRGMNIMSIILSKLPSLLISEWADYSYPLICKEEKPKLDILSEFLSEEATKISKTAVNFSSVMIPTDLSTSTNKRKQNDSNYRAQTLLVQSNSTDTADGEEKCRCCHTSKHSLINCKKFKKSLRKDRWFYVKRNGICFKCLVSRHNKETCPAAACDIDNCGQPHHRMLHYKNHNNLQNKSSTKVNNITDKSTGPRADCETVTHVNTSKCKVLLKTVPLKIHGSNGVIDTVALLDDGSTVSLISASLASRVGLRGSKQTLRVRGAWNATELECESEIVEFTVSNKDGASHSLRARSTNVISLPAQNIPTDYLSRCDFMNGIKEQLCCGHCKPEILVGQDNYHLLLPLQVMKGGPDFPYATRTPLGWCIHGSINMARADGRVSHSTLFLEEQSQTEKILQDLHEEVRQSFSIESMGVSSKPRENADDVRAWEHLEYTSTLQNGRWHVGLPWKDIHCKMPDSYQNAFLRLRGVEKKMKLNKEFAGRYCDRITHLLQNDYAAEVANTKSSDRTWYLPHFGVDNPNKKKLRLVFDAAARCQGLSLNDYLLKGPDLLSSLYGIMLRFRENKIAVMGDIRDMFLRIKIRPEDRSALRFLWRDPSENADNPIKTYEMTSLIFGANCSPFIAQFIKNKNAQPYQSTMPNAVEAICKQHYMDDYIDSIDDELMAIQLVKNVTYIHKQGGFDIRNWTSNNEAVLESLPKETLGPTAVKFKIGSQNEGERTLGLIWFPADDTLGFDVSFKRLPSTLITGEKRPTKREILRIVMSIFDVYGFISPFTIRGKILLQKTWKLDLGWDEFVPDSIYNGWVKWLQILKKVHTIRLRRCYRASVRGSESTNVSAVTDKKSPSQSQSHAPPPPPPPRALCSYDSLTTCATEETIPKASSYGNLQLHTFCDASTQAMCAVAYWRWINDDGGIQAAFVSSKCRVAPTKHVSVPRLELQAAVLAARLSDSITKEHRMAAVERYFWCDSSTVLHWIRNTARSYKPYVAHRLGEIDELTAIAEWRYISTNINVADIATRDNCDLSILNHEWFYGPDFLYAEKCEWPVEKHFDVCSEDLECVNLLIATKPLPDVPEPERFSSWLRLLKATYIVLKFINKCKKLTCDLDGELMQKAECLLIKYSQAKSFPEELELLKNKKPLDKKSKLLTLSPYLDEHGILRVGGRISAAPEMDPEMTEPVILDGRDHISTLIVRHYHVKFAHGNQETVVNELKQRYWVIRLRPTVKRIAFKCMLCRIKRAQPRPPRMGDLPRARMSHHQRPFTFCGLDLFGPMEVTVCRRREKRYGVLFTCLTVRAIHVEIVTNLTSDALIMALRRMAARRDWPQHLYSDNGTNLRGAETELKRSIRGLDEELLKREALNFGTTWTFIPPQSPHWGGAWERLIRSVKVSLKVVLKEQAPRDEVLSTLLAEVEQMVNSRPLTHVSVEPNTEESLTPNHFLLGTSSNLPVIGIFDNADMYLRKQWRMSQRLADLFWKRWVREVLPEMRPRRKWQQEQRSLQVGDLVLIVDPDSPRGLWPRGLVQAVMAGRDGRVRVVEVKTKSGVLRRSATRVARIPVGDEC